MKITIFLYTIFIASVVYCAAQPTNYRPVFWDSVGQRVTITYGERYEFFWRGASPDSCIIRYIPIPSAEKYILEVTAAPITKKIIKVARAVYTDKNDKHAFLKELEWTEPDTTLYWHYEGQKHCVPFGKKVNFQFPNPDLKHLNKYYITYEVNPDGYCMGMSSTNKITYLHFRARCQKYIVPDPSYVSITYDDAVKYEQIVWTPLLNGMWEARMGTVEQGCIGEGLDWLFKMQEKSEYKNNLIIDKSNFQRSSNKRKTNASE